MYLKNYTSTSTVPSDQFSQTNCWPSINLLPRPQAREALQVTVDGEYSLLVAGKNMSIFCLGMNSTSPTEYLTLPAGEEGNFAEMYNKM